jgi:hypothetical protein
VFFGRSFCLFVFIIVSSVVVPGQGVLESLAESLWGASNDHRMLLGDIDKSVGHV